MLATSRTIILAGARSPVTFFGYPGVPSYFISPEHRTLTLATPEEDVETALDALADLLGAPAAVEVNPTRQVPPLPTGPLTAENLSAVVAAMIPANAIVMDESNTSMGPFMAMAQSAHPHTVLTQPGGAIGLGPPCATGAAIASPERVVLNLQADGSAMYTIQALWTQAREALNVKTLICNNRSYRILGIELMRAGITQFGDQVRNLVGLDRPGIDWVQLSQGLGVPASRVDTAEALALALERALATPGPVLIEAAVV